MLLDYKITIEPPRGGETESTIVVWGENPDEPFINAPPSQVEAFAHRLLQEVTRARRQRFPSVQRG